MNDNTSQHYTIHDLSALSALSNTLGSMTNEEMKKDLMNRKKSVEAQKKKVKNFKSELQNNSNSNIDINIDEDTVFLIKYYQYDYTYTCQYFNYYLIEITQDFDDEEFFDSLKTVLISYKPTILFMKCLKEKYESFTFYFS